MGTTYMSTLKEGWHSCASALGVIDPLFFLWTHKFQLKLTFMRPTGRTSIYFLTETFNAKSLTIFCVCYNKASFIPIKHRNIPVATDKGVEVF